MWIEEVKEKEKKEQIAGEILAELPEWFGLPESTAEYIRESRELPFWAAWDGAEEKSCPDKGGLEENKRALGFIALKETSPYTAEVYVMGVCRKLHGKGTGKALFQALHSYAARHGYLFLQVKTVKQGCYEEYDRTGAFYKKMGFVEFECFPELWDAWNPCQIYVMSL